MPTSHDNGHINGSLELELKLDTLQDSMADYNVAIFGIRFVDGILETASFCIKLYGADKQ